MSTPKKNLYDAFLSYTAVDKHLARKLSSELTHNGISVFFEPQPVGAMFSNEIRNLIAESPAFIVLLGPKSVNSPNIAVEVGAATAWRKSIFLVRHGIRTASLPTYLASYRTFTSSEARKVAEAIKLALSPLSAEQMDLLRSLYVEFAVPSDRLASDTSSLEKLTNAFNRTAKTSFASERLLQEMLRQRKKGRWPRLKRAAKPLTRLDATSKSVG